jgi:isoaspartyl peptidase/L-asparaginase-like protein (Ntn-hydrolase superfamily)
MINRKSFLKTLALAGGSLSLPKFSSGSKSAKGEKPTVISTWDFGIQANKTAWKVLSKNGAALDAVEKGVHVVEADPDIQTVGYGGLPDRDGYVTLDSCVMNHKNHCGAVVFLRDIMHPSSVARKVMEDTKYITLAGNGALEFALDQGFKRQNLLTLKSKKDWEEWKKKNEYQPQTPPVGSKNHDTIGMIALDEHGHLAGICTTSGIAYKMHGRVADSGIVGAGMYVDGNVGGAAATGVGEEVIRAAGSHAVVELMRQGLHPQEACKQIVKRIANFDHKRRPLSSIQEGFIALNKNGEYGAYGLRKGFKYALHNQTGNQLIDSDHLID